MLEKRLKVIMIDDDVKQTDVAKKLKISQSSVSQMLRKGMSLERFEELCRILGYDVILKKGDRTYGVKCSNLGKH